MSAIAGGLFMPAYENLWTPELLAADPNYAIIKKQVSVAEPFLGETWPAKPAPQFGAIRATGLVEQSVGNAIAKRMTPAEAVADAHRRSSTCSKKAGSCSRKGNDPTMRGGSWAAPLLHIDATVPTAHLRRRRSALIISERQSAGRTGWTNGLR